MRYAIPGDVLLAAIVQVLKAYDGVRIAALAFNEGDPAAAGVALEYLTRCLDTLHEALRATFEEQKEIEWKH